MLKIRAVAFWAIAEAAFVTVAIARAEKMIANLDANLDANWD
jgi:hypothetical protein